MADRGTIRERISREWAGRVTVAAGTGGCTVRPNEPVQDLAQLCGWLVHQADHAFASLVVEQHADKWELRYLFHGCDPATGWVHVLVEAPAETTTLPSIVAQVQACDWHEREAEDQFGLSFESHPHLGDFVLHDDVWQEGLAPMRKSFDAHRPVVHRAPDAHWRPRRIVQESGAFVMPVGPVYSAVAESSHFILETVGEDVIRAFPRLFYDHRAIEKMAEGRQPDHVLLIAERFAATTAFAHATAFAQAAEAVGDAEPPARARMLRVYLAELERLRHHAGAIADICESTALAVAAAQASAAEEELLRASAALAGHRYLFGLAAIGGLTRDFDEQALRASLARVESTGQELDRLDAALRTSSSFLDRLEEVGVIPRALALEFCLAGPLARASGVLRDLRRVLPYAGYAQLAFDTPVEEEGDGYARLRVLFAEARQSRRLMRAVLDALPGGQVHVPVPACRGAALGWTEAPRGAAFHWLRIGEDGQVARWRVAPPSFANWHAFRFAAERFAFQDFPIILASLVLSVAESDR